MNIKVSIVIPVYNSESHLNKCLESIRFQTYKNFEVILVNDGSTDNSGNICNYYSELDERFKVIHSDNRGVSSARNKGINLSRGKYLIFVDSDDKVKPNMLESMVNHMENSSVDVLISGISFIENGRLTKEINPTICGEIDIGIWKYICEDTSGLYGYVPNKMYRMSVIKENKIYFDTKRKIQEDLDFALRVYSKSDLFYLLNESYYLYEYEEKNRKPDSIGYMEIEINKRNILKEKNIFNRYCKYHFRKIASMIFTYLYYLPKDKIIFNQEVSRLYKLDNINDSLDLKYISNFEEKIIIFLLKKQFINSIRIYFTIRNRIRDVINNRKLRYSR